MKKCKLQSDFDQPSSLFHSHHVPKYDNVVTHLITISGEKLLLRYVWEVNVGINKQWSQRIYEVKITTGWPCDVYNAFISGEKRKLEAEMASFASFRADSGDDMTGYPEEQLNSVRGVYTLYV